MDSKRYSVAYAATIGGRLVWPILTELVAWTSRAAVIAAGADRDSLRHVHSDTSGMYFTDGQSVYRVLEMAEDSTARFGRAERWAS